MFEMFPLNFKGAAVALGVAVAAFAASVGSFKTAESEPPQDKPTVNLSEAESAVRESVEEIARATKESLGVEISAEQKARMVNSSLCRMAAQSVYEFVPAPSCP